MTKRSEDINGYLLVKGNPISKVGVFPYMGSEIGAPNPNRIYQVYRPEEELSDPETLESFNLLPFINDHEFLGKDGTPAEKKGVQGTTGENATFDFPYLKNSLRVYSTFLKDQIEAGKTELSPSYRCDYEFSSGVFDGQKYDAIQRNIRGNHLALVDKGRTGPDVAVLDHYIITTDSAEFIKMDFTPEQQEQLRALILQILAEQNSAVDEEKKPEDAEAFTEEEKDAVEEVVSETEAAVEAVEEAAETVGLAAEAILEVQEALEAVEEAAEEVEAAPTADSMAKLRKAIGAVKTRKTKKVALDTGEVIRQIAARDKLAKRLVPHIGTFDVSSMISARDVAKYGVRKLGIKASDGMEAAVLEGYLQAVKPASETIVQDRKYPAGSSASKFWKE